MKDFEREELNTAELEQIGEFASFPAEEFKSNELYLNNKEEFKVKEIQPQSFVKNEETTLKKEKVIDNKQDKLRQKLNHNLNSSLSSATSGSSAASIASLTITAALATGIVVSPLFNETNYGILDFINYKIEITESMNENNEIELTKGVYLYFKEELNDDYIAVVQNNQTQENYLLEDNYIYFDNLSLDEYEFEVKIFENDECVDSFVIPVKTYSKVEYINDLAFEYLITYNSDNTSNIYFIPTSELFNEIDLVNSITLYDENETLLNYENVNYEEVLAIENINEDNYNLEFKSYYVEDENYYLVSKEKIKDIKSKEISFDTSLDFDKLTINIYDEVLTDMKITIDYLDKEGSEEFTISKDSWLSSSSQVVSLSKVSENIKVSIEGEVAKTPDNSLISNYKGSTRVNLESHKELDQIITSTLKLARIEVLNESFDVSYASIPTNVYYEGYIKDGDYLNVNVYDSTNNIIASQENITSTNETITFLDLDTTQELTLEYILYDQEGNKISEEQYQFMTALPSQYENIGYSAVSVNPGDAYLTYNDDLTFNAYFYTNFSHDTEFELYYKLVLENEGVEAYSLISDKEIAIFENLDSNNHYAIYYTDMVKHDLVYYALKDKVVPSGTLGFDIEEGYGINGYIAAYDTETAQIYDVYLGAKIFSDLEVTVILDETQEIKLTIPLSDIIDSSFILDLSSYTYETFIIDVIGMMNPFASFKDLIESTGVEIKGNYATMYKLRTIV